MQVDCDIRSLMALVFPHRRNELLLTHNLHQQRPGSAAHNKALKKPLVPKKLAKSDTHPQPSKVQRIQSRALVRATSKVSVVVTIWEFTMKLCSMYNNSNNNYNREEVQCMWLRLR